MNYPYFDAKLNVIRVSDLGEEILEVYDDDSSYGFCSLDVVKMFDNIPMDKLYKIILTMGMRFNGGAVNAEALVELMRLDCELLDFLKFSSPRKSGDKSVKFYHQRKGIPMGGNTSSIYADLFMSFCMSKIKFQLDALGVKLTRKYVDDFLFYLPKKNFKKLSLPMEEATGLDFTLEEPLDGVLPFLDLQIVDKGGVVKIR